ncbi:hypothetical protein [Kutzneria sp. NPDC052558]|uniref:hypothetical protein n=1 Tax=Kutzneria sp. NPDC052558 TaxID=3364121 RepID=UPI0037C521F7
MLTERRRTASPEVMRRPRLGQKMKGIGRVYDHMAPTAHVLRTLEARWHSSH